MTHPIQLPIDSTAGQTRPPRHLSAASKRFWRAILGDFILEPHHIELLRLACEALDRAAEARIALADGNVLVDGRYGPRLSPMVAVERDSALRAARLLNLLGLDLSDGRPPSRWHT